MTEKQITNSIKTKALKLNTWGKFTHFGIVIFLMLIPVAIGFDFLKKLFSENPKPLREGTIWFFIIPIIIATLAYYLQKNRLKFKLIDTHLTRKELDKVIEGVAKNYNWTFSEIKDNSIILKTHPKLTSGSWGEQISILFNKNEVLVNSICDPEKSSSLVSFGRNKKNEEALIKEIKKASS